jgi:hypothetical protein
LEDKSGGNPFVFVVNLTDSVLHKLQKEDTKLAYTKIMVWFYTINTKNKKKLTWN